MTPAEQAEQERALDRAFIDHDSWVTSFRDGNGSHVGHVAVEHQSTDETVRRITRARHLAQLAEDERDGFIDPLGQARRRLARRVTSGRGALARRLAERHHGLLWHLV
jgi:hypothetical protein